MELSDNPEKKFYEKDYPFKIVAISNSVSFVIGLWFHYLFIDAGH